MGLLSRLARRASDALTTRKYDLPLGNGASARMIIHQATDWGAKPLPPAWVTRLPFGSQMAEASAPKVSVVNWGFGDQQSIINKLNPETRQRLGLRAMREVMKALERDARRNSPARYEFVGATPAHRKLYASLLDRARAIGYEPSDGYAGSVFLTRQYTPVSDYLGRDALADAALYGGVGAGGLWAANANR